MMTEQIRNKYNTLTPAEAKKLNRYHQLAGNNHRAPPIRTASVLHRPRAPPIVVTNLDNTIEHQLLDNGLPPPPPPPNSGCYETQFEGQGADARTAFSESMQNGSIYQSGCDRRHSINYGRSSRQSLFSTASITRNSTLKTQRQPKISSHDSLSNLSFRSSRDVPDCAHEQANQRFQTMSVDLGGGGNNKHSRPASIAYDTMRARLRYGSQRSNTISTKFSDDSFSSAKSEVSNVSGRSSSVTPTKFSHFPAIAPEPPRSASKLSLSSSTYKVFQSPLANFKRLFRGMHRPFSQASNHATESQQNQAGAKIAEFTKQQQCDKSLADFSLSDSISQLSLNKSQSPTVLPPPPSELKSMSYIESDVSYSNYDEFTRSRNERGLGRGNLRNNLSNEGSNAGDAPARAVSKQDGSNKMSPNTFTSNHQQHELQLSSFNKSDDSDESTWQMTSLPVYYERNLTTVFEEKQSSRLEIVAGSHQAPPNLAANFDRDLTVVDADEIYQTIKPPKRFDNDPNSPPQHIESSGVGAETKCERAPSVDSSKSQPHSLATSTITGDTNLDFHRQQPATPFRFSFAQPLNDTDLHTSLNANLGLPPRMPAAGGYHHHQQTGTTATLIISENHQRQDNSSSGNSSNCSSQMNGINYCDRLSSLESSTGTTATTNQIDKLSLSLDNDSGGYGTNLNDLENDPDSTILSEASTIRGENGTLFYTNKCAELERTIATLKNKLIAKEKELTELQLAQLNNDYTIERYRKQVNKLEKENAQLRTMVARNSQTNSTGGNNTISRMQI